MSNDLSNEKIEMPFPWEKRIRCLALGIIKNREGKILVHLGNDPVKKESFYRPLGGGIEYGEKSEVAVVREFEEELGLKIRLKGAPKIFENIFTYYGRPGHEIVFIFEAEFEDSSAYQKNEFDIIEGGKVVGQAVWASREDVKREGGRLYPTGIEKFVF